MTSAETCSVADCFAPRASRWRCVEHYAVGGRRCSAEGCEQKHYGNGLCRFHWTRQRDGVPLDTPRHEPIQVCTFAGCERGHHSLGYCKTHYDRLKLWGDPAISKRRPVPPPRPGTSSPTWKGDAAGYHAVHKRLEATRGKARQHLCACGDPATQWAYDRAAPDEKVQTIRSGKTWREAPYSHDLSHYLPMCTRCHIAFDRR